MPHTEDATHYYLQAVEKLKSWSVTDTRTIVSLLQRVLELDPHYYRAYIALCNCYTWMGALNQISQEEATVKINDCLSFLKDVDHNLPEYYTLIAKRTFWVEWNIPTALRNCNRALKIHRTCSDTLILKGLITAAMGKKGKATELLHKAERLSPLTQNINYFLGLIYMYSGNMEKAILYIDRNIRISPRWHQQYYEKVSILCALNRLTEVEQLISELEAEESCSVLFISILKAHLCVANGKKEEARNLMKVAEAGLDQRLEKTHPYFSYLAELSVLLQNQKRSLYFFKWGIQCKSTPLTFFHANYLWDEYRSLPEFIEITEGLFYPQKECSGRYEKSELSSERSDTLVEELEGIMRDEKPWLDSSLNRDRLSKTLGISAHQFSQLLNNRMSCGFHDYCNSYRLEHFLELSSSPEYANTTLLYRAFESGFRAKTTFNSFFRKKMGTTPTRYFKEQ